MSHIAIDARELRTSTGRYIERLLHYLQEIDQNNDYSVLLRPGDIAGWQPTNARFTPVACPHKEFTFDEQLGFKKQLDQLRPDLVHFGMTQQPVMYKGRTVTTIHDLTTLRFINPGKNKVVFKVKQQVYDQVVQRVARRSNAIITPSNFVKNDLVDYTGISPEKVVVTHEAADAIPNPGEAVPGLSGKQFLLYVGRPFPHKNLPRLIQAFALLKAQHPGAVLVLTGKKHRNYQQSEAEIQRLGLGGSVVLTGFVSEAQLRWLYEHCAAYVFPSLSEGFGLPGLEAMMHGAPVVSSNATCLPEIYGDAAHYFDPLDTQNMADSIDEVLTDEKLRNQLVQKGHLQAQKYSWKRMAEQTLTIYNKVLN